MSRSNENDDWVYNEEDFKDSVIIRPISLKPSVIPSVLQRGNPQNTILATYDKIKLTDYIEPSEQGRIIKLISLDENSLMTILNPEGIEFLEKYSGTDIAFVTVTGDRGVGKSFFVDKVLNLANVQGNNFSMAESRPAINLWSTPFVRDDLKFFIAEVSGCSPGSKQFNMLLPYITILSSLIINIDNFKANSTSSYEKLTEKLLSFMNQFESAKLTQEESKRQIFGQIFPQLIVQVNRNQSKVKLVSQEIRTQEVYLPDAKNPEYRGIDDDLRIHSFLNKKCINQQYIRKVSEIFLKVISQVHEKKHRELVFNGGIILKYLGQLSLLFHKGKRIDIGKVYTEIVKDLYLSAYNYCVICYHQSLQAALSDERPRSVDELIQIFDKASGQIFEKYNEFSLDKTVHQQYEEKLQKHIESKQRLILEINKKKTDLQLKKAYDENVNMNDFSKVWGQMQAVNQKYPNFTHGRDQTMGRKLAEIIGRLKTGNNVDYRVMKQIQNLKTLLALKKQELWSIRETNKKTQTEVNEKNKNNEQKKNEFLSIHQQTDKKIGKIRKELKNLQQSMDSTDTTNLKNEEKELQNLSAKNIKTLEKLKAELNEPVENSREAKDLQKRIQDVQSKIRLQEMTLKEIQGNAKVNQNNQAEQSQMRLKKEGPKPTNNKPGK